MGRCWTGVLCVVAVVVGVVSVPAFCLGQAPEAIVKLDEKMLALNDAGEHGKALKIAEKILVMEEKRLGPMHADLVPLLINVVRLADLDGQVERAVKAFVRVLAITEADEGPEHPDVANILENLAIFLNSKGDLARAEPFYLRALAIREKTFGPEHVQIAIRVNQLAMWKHNRGDYNGAEPLFLRALAIVEKRLGADSPDVAVVLDNVGGLYRDKGDYKEAIARFQRALDIREKKLGPEDPNVAVTLNNLALVHFILAQHAIAKPLYLRALKINEKHFGADGFALATPLHNLALLHDKAGDHDEAQSMFKRATSIYEKHLGTESPEVATSLSALAESLRKQGQIDEAEPHCKRALAIRTKAFGDKHPEVATSLQELASIHTARGELKAAETLLTRALGIKEAHFGPEHIEVAGTLSALGVFLSDSGEHERSEPILRRALKLFEKGLGPDHLKVAVALFNLGSALQNKGALDEAEATMARSLSIRRQSLDPLHLELALSLRGLARIKYDKGELESAEPLYKEALRIQENNPVAGDEELASTLHDLGVLMVSLNDYAASEPLLTKALALRERRTGTDSLYTASTLKELGSLYTDRGDYKRAEPFLQRALAIREKHLGPEHMDTASSLNALALHCKLSGDLKRAEGLYLRALAIFEQASGADHTDVAIVLDNLGGLYEKMGDADKAEPLRIRALSILEAKLGPEHLDVAVALNNVAQHHAEEGAFDKAAPLFQRALGIYKSRFGAQHPLSATLLYNLADMHRKKGDLDLAVDFLAQCNETQEISLQRILKGGSEQQKRAYLELLNRETEGTVALHLIDAAQREDAARLAFLTLLRRKGRALDAQADTLAAIRRRLDGASAPIFDELSDLHAQVAQRSLKGTPPGDLKVMEARIDALERSLAEESRAFGVVSRPVTIEAVQARIPQGTALAEFVVFTDNNVSRYGVYVLRGDGELGWAELGESAPIDKLVEAFRRGIIRRQGLSSRTARPLTRPNEGPEQDLGALGRALYEKLIAPMMPLLDASRHILLSPDGQLNLLPFDALLQPSGRFLIESHQITYLTSGRDLLRLDDERTGLTAPVIVAAPDYDLADQTDAEGDPEALRGQRRSMDMASMSWAKLAGTEAEAAQIVGLLPKARILKGAEASETALKAIIRPSILHIATHGFFLDDEVQSTFEARGGQFKALSLVASAPVRTGGEDPLLRSGLVLAGANRVGASGVDDGYLTASEVSSMDLWGTRAVVLSACETGLGEVKKGQGVFGLRRALVLAGSQSQVMSLWQVSDKATERLMVAYYRRLLDGEGRTQALRQARIELMTQTVYEHPYFWSAFIPSGDWRSLDGQEVQRSAEDYVKVVPGPRGCACHTPASKAPPPKAAFVISMLLLGVWLSRSARREHGRSASGRRRGPRRCARRACAGSPGGGLAGRRRAARAAGGRDPGAVGG